MPEAASRWTTSGSTSGAAPAGPDEASDPFGVRSLYALRLGEASIEEGIPLSGIRFLFVAGEPGGSIPAVRQRLEELWPVAAIVDHHGMTEVGPVSWQHQFEKQMKVGEIFESEAFPEAFEIDHLNRVSADEDVARPVVAVVAGHRSPFTAGGEIEAPDALGD
jgi:hypothetical protein